ncbi:MAG: hypothetical protein LLG20_18455 [Acidobacteriales bacterium]|nr:hypothetical protein [Terriglobales bacterium]
MMTTMKGSGASPVNPGEIKRISVERAANGFTVEIRRKEKPVKANQLYDFDANTENLVFNDLEAMLDGIRKAFGAKAEKKAEG